MRRLPRCLLAILASCLTIYPLVLGYCVAGIRAPFEFFASDTFYYLAIANNSTAKTLFSYDGTRPTNGFHPLWQYLLRLLTISIPSFSNERTQILFAYISSAVLVSVAAGLLVLTVRRFTGNALLSLLAVVPGFYYIGLSFADRNYNAIWSFANGMESPLSLFFFSIFIYFAARSLKTFITSAALSIVLGVILALTVLSRLDDAFLVMALPLGFFVAWRRPGWWRGMFALCGIPFVTVVGYCLFNKGYAGTFMPISGAVKSGVALRGNVGMLLYVVFPRYPLERLTWRLWSDGTWRALQLVVPMLAAGGMFLRQIIRWKNKRHAPSPRQRLLMSLYLYVLLKGGYNFVFVMLFQQGHWYFPISIFVFNLIIALLLRDWMRSPVGGRWTHAAGRSIRLIARPALLLVAVAYIVYAANTLTASKDLAGPGGGISLWQNRDAVRAKIDPLLNNGGILEFDDGIVAYSLREPTMAGMGYALDLEAAKAKVSGKLLPLAYQRGFRLIGTVFYTGPLPDQPGTVVNDYLAGNVPWLTPDELRDWQFVLRYRDPQSGAQFIEFKPKPNSGL